MDEAQIKRRELGVMFRDLRVIGLGASTSYIPTLGSMFTLSNFLEAIQAIRHPPVRDILDGFEGVVRPGEMLCRCLCLNSMCALPDERYDSDSGIGYARLRMFHVAKDTVELARRVSRR